MELLVGAVIAFLMQIYKKINEKFGVNNSNLLVLGGVFLMSLIYSVLRYKGIISENLLKVVVEIFAYAVATYQVVYKAIILPIISKK